MEIELTVQVPTAGAATCTCSLVLTESATDSPLPLYLSSRGWSHRREGGRSGCSAVDFMCTYLTPVGEVTSRFRSCSSAFVVEPPTDGGSYQARVTLQHSKAQYSAVRDACVEGGCSRAY